MFYVYKKINGKDLIFFAGAPTKEEINFANIELVAKIADDKLTSDLLTYSFWNENTKKLELDLELKKANTISEETIKVTQTVSENNQK